MLWLLRNGVSQSIKERVNHLSLLLTAALLYCENWTASKTASELLYAMQKFLHIRCLQGMGINGQCARPCSCEHLQDWATEESQMTNPCLSLSVTAKCTDKTLGLAEAGSYAWDHQDLVKMCGRWLFSLQVQTEQLSHVVSTVHAWVQAQPWLETEAADEDKSDLSFNLVSIQTEGSQTCLQSSHGNIQRPWPWGVVQNRLWEILSKAYRQ